MYAMLYAKQLVSYSHEPNIKNCEGLGEGREGLESSGVIQNNPLPPHKKIISSIFIEIDFFLDSNHQMDFT